MDMSWWGDYSTHRTPFLSQFPLVIMRMSVSGDGHLPESEAIFILDHQLRAWSSLGKSSKQMSIK